LLDTGLSLFSYKSFYKNYSIDNYSGQQSKLLLFYLSSIINEKQLCIFPLLTYLSACTYHCAADITVLKELKVFPNPVDDVWIIQYNSCNAGVVKLINLNGVEVLNLTLPC
jgi:hypothetical protein